ncbi:putative cytochrome p450 protein [Phaeoacremonium minimum UCRPA7]|uniref:Putative cytochrome p450 protein n=1 Tax=Phaeoacremonium minimum (strain UCR-PA7) TaxID=1286976 RepID=R8BNT7_PHAM7|nr:putative cytochrome p450 protein [Phaeoacremonium minimum UCRPA7]EOO01012.1 putative cytochrome p450 protein [Phaeoacremonium minimum UCRPA7]
MEKQNYCDQIWGYDTHDGIKLVIPRNRWDEFRNHPSFTFKASVDNDMLVEYTKFGGPPDYFNKAITGGLNPTLGEYVPVLHALIIKHMKSVVGEFDNWEEIRVHERVLKLVTRVSSRAFYGSSTTDSDEWLGIAYGYLGAVIATIRLLKTIPPVLRPVVHFFSPQKKAIKKQFKEASKFVTETIQLRRQLGGIQLDSPPSLFDHLTTGKNVIYAEDIDAQTLHQMTLIAVGNSTTVSSAIQAVYDLIDRPEHIPALLEEIQRAERDENGFLTRSGLQEMRFMDSFLKESFRLNGSGITTFARASIEDVTLKDGIFIPKGTKIEIAAGAIDRDPNKWPNPLSFDATRHLKARERPGHEHKHTFVSTSADDLGFGYGRHVCPGRYLTDIVDKLVICELLLNYELKFLPGKRRPTNIEYENIAEADPSASILIKSKTP